MAIGSKFAYATDRPIEDAIGPALKYNEQMAFKYREEAEKAKEKQDAVKKANQAIPELKATTTPYSNRNAFIYDTLNKLKTGMVEKQRLADLGKISQQESNLFKQNALQNIDLLNQSSKRITDLNANMVKLISEEKVADGFEKDALALGGAIDKNQLFPEVNPDGTLKVTVYDVDANGKKRILDSGGLDKIGEVAYAPVRNVKFEDYLKQFRETHPIDFTEKFNGNTKIGTKQLTPRLESSINDYADALLADKDALAVAYKNATGNIKRDITDVKDIQLAKDYLTNYIKDSYNKEISVDEATQRASLAHRMAQDKKDEIQAKPFVSDTPLRNDIKGDNLDPKSYYKGSIGFDEGKLKFNNLGGKSSGINNGYVTSFHLEKDGHVIATAKYLIDKGQKFKLPNGKEVKFQVASDLYNDPDTDQETKETLKPQLDSYTTSASYGDTYKIYSGDSPELNSLARKAGYNSKDALVSDLRKLNRDEIIANKAKPVQKETPRERALRLARK